jgi:hypothetical protein
MGDDMVGKPLSSDRWSAVTTPTLGIDGGASCPRSGTPRSSPSTSSRTLAGSRCMARQRGDPVLTEFFTC